MTLMYETAWEAVRVMVAVVAGVALLAGAVAVAAPAAAQEPPPNTPCPADTPQAAFVDRDQARSGHAPSIDCVAFHAIAAGSTTPAGDPVYLPAGTVTRAQMATFIANALDAVGADLPDGDAPDEFTDIADTVHRPRINALARAAIVAGFGDDSYRPNQAVTRDQMATFIVQAAEWALGEDLPADAGPYFADTDGNTHEANIDAGFQAGLYEGRVAPDPDTPRSGRYAPDDHTRRDQMATFLSRLLDDLWEPLPTRAVLEPDTEVAEVSDVADPSNATPSSGDVDFWLTLFDEDDEPVTPIGRNFTFVVENTGDNDVVVCVRCEAPDSFVINPGEALTILDAPNRNRVRVDAAAPTTVTVTGQTSSGTGGVTLSDTAQAEWVLPLD